MYALEPEPETGRRWRTITAGAALGAACLSATLLGVRAPQSVVEQAPSRVVLSFVTTPREAQTVRPHVAPQPPQQAAKPPKLAPKTKASPSPSPAPEQAEPRAPDVGVDLAATSPNGSFPSVAVGSTSLGESQIVAPPPRPVLPPTAASANVAVAVSAPPRPRVAAKLLSSPAPRYPGPARAEGVEGVVVLRISIDSSGRVTAASVLQGLGFGLDEAALESVKSSSWEPASEGGKPVSSDRKFNVRFSLQG